MNSNNNDYEWIGWVVSAVLGIFFVIYIVSSSNNNKMTDSTTESSASSTVPSTGAAAEVTPAEDNTTWHCVDKTSYNQNAYDDNKCTKGTETQYVSDSQAIELDPSYSPGKAGAAYYNSR